MATYTQTPIDDSAVSGDGSVSETALSFPQTRVDGSTAESGVGVSFTEQTFSAVGATDSRAVADETVEINTLTFSGTAISRSVVGADGVIIPTGSFRDVTVWVEDAEGKPLTSAEWVQSSGLFPTAARVEQTEDGRMKARLWLLEAAYYGFSVLADSGRESVDYVWYQVEAEDDGPAIEPSDREATLRFNEKELAGNATNLSVGYGASIGGS